jgi:hypothetical protein
MCLALAKPVFFSSHGGLFWANHVSEVTCLVSGKGFDTGLFNVGVL